MQITCVDQFKQRKGADLFVLPFWQEKKHPVLAASGSSGWESVYAPALASGDFTGKAGELLCLYPKGRGKEKRLFLLGLGPRQECTAEGVRRASSSLVKEARRCKVKSLNFALPQKSPLDGIFALALCQGALLANYSFESLKNEPATTPLLTKLCLIGADPKLQSLYKCEEKIAAAVYYARDLVNCNADDVTPAAFAREAKELAKGFASIKTVVLAKKELEKEKLGLLLAVGRGAVHEPHLIFVEYRGDPESKNQTAIVGKGITYDTGGLNIKPTGSMETMKCDMAGAAAVLGTLRAAASLQLKVNLLGVIATAENAIGPLSYKPGDVYKSYSGKTVEITNTDAEGRLVLADALSYLQKNYEPKRIIDLATLTGGIVIALGDEASGLFANDDQLASRLIHAGEVSGERLWRLPLFPEYRELLKSSIADIKNSGPRKATSITAAIFLQEFVDKKIPWAHIDIAGTALLAEPRYYHPTLATGVGVRLLIQFLTDEIKV